jgi:hypothetical protein
MHKLFFAAALSGATLISGLLYSSSAMAQAGVQRQFRPHHVRWGDRDFEIIRWSYGDCKIWHDDGGPPAGTGWVVLADGLRTRDEAWRVLVQLQRLRRCS